MTRDEAIIQVCDILYGYEDVPEAMYKNACNRVREIIQQIDKPEWHKVAEEGVPKESGYYVLYLGKNKLEVAGDQYCRVPVYKTCMYNGMTPFPESLVAWRKFDLFEEE